jgi:hypothetical protein
VNKGICTDSAIAYGEILKRRKGKKREEEEEEKEKKKSPADNRS